jgi:hypothetical protein
MRMRELKATLLVSVAAAALVGCLRPSDGTRVPKSTLVIGIDVSGSFNAQYDDAITFAARYLYGHLNGYGDLRVPSAVFVGAIGGGKPGEAKSFQPVHAFRGKTPEEIEASIRELYPSEDSFTDFNVFFDRVATLVKRQNLILAPLNIVMFSDGVHDLRGNTSEDASPYEQIDLGPLEYLSRNVTVRLLYPSPTVAVDWERRVKRQRVRVWTVDAPVMLGWHDQVADEVPYEMQDDLWKWVTDNVNFRVRSRRL